MFVGREGSDERGRRYFSFFLLFLLLVFFFRSTKIGPQVFVGTEGKVDYATRATRGHKKVVV